MLPTETDLNNPPLPTTSVPNSRPSPNATQGYCFPLYFVIFGLLLLLLFDIDICILINVYLGAMICAIYVNYL